MESKQPRENPNIIHVSNKRNKKLYLFLGKQLLKEHGWIELQALGKAITIAVETADALVR